MFLSILLILLPLFVLILGLTRLYIQIDYIFKEGESELSIKVQFWRFIRLKREIPIEFDSERWRMVTMEKTKMNQKDLNEKEKDYKPHDFVKRVKKGQQMVKQIYHANVVIKKFLSKIRVHSLRWNTRIGLHDASTTGRLAGVLWSIKGSMAGIISHFMKLMKRPEIHVEPEFQKTVIETDFQCMISFRIGQAMYAMLRLVRRFNRNQAAKRQTG
ncbi:DUF2953 family protein [Melghiribacillus thermohalophilus]|uniref:DUF2953 family protein n=1 Tax=Melghiribacillus thermohalophilus TaxID=1324956 RepID=A0A4R3N8P3_9BACI|nr:DUF2953 family protein [Melghiribacillus thermohalophilus]